MRAFWRRRHFRKPPEQPPIPNDENLYRFENWTGSMSLGNSSGSRGSDGVWLSQSQGVSHTHENGRYLEVTSHFDGDYEELKMWAPVNMCLFEASKETETPEAHEERVQEMQDDIWNSRNPWNSTRGTIDGHQAKFEILTVGDSFAAISKLHNNVITIISRGIPPLDLRLIALSQSQT